MTNFDRIFEFVQDAHGIITSEQAARLGIPSIELVKLAHRGRLEREGQGVYRVPYVGQTDDYPFALDVALVGHGAFLYGESVLALLSLCPTNPRTVFVATTARIRRTLPQDIDVIRVSDSSAVVYYRGIRSQPVGEAILACRGRVMNERLLQAIDSAQRSGYVSPTDAATLREQLGEKHA